MAASDSWHQGETTTPHQKYRMLRRMLRRMLGNARISRLDFLYLDVPLSIAPYLDSVVSFFTASEISRTAVVAISHNLDVSLRLRCMGVFCGLEVGLELWEGWWLRHVDKVEMKLCGRSLNGDDELSLSGF